jgi:hypothetical protein
LQGAECAGEEDERVFEGRGAHVVDAAYDDPVIARGVLGDDLALECGEGVVEQRYAAGSEFPVETDESIRAGGGRVLRRARAVVLGCSRRSGPRAASGTT